jgi:2-methylisocitrate lyase-like PEP mutase family enzyme
MLERRAETWIQGTAEQAVERLQALAAAGVERVYLQHLAHEDVELVRFVGAEIAPAVS